MQGALKRLAGLFCSGRYEYLNIAVLASGGAGQHDWGVEEVGRGGGWRRWEGGNGEMS